MKNDFFTPFHMATHHTTSTEFSSAICRTRTSAICLFVCTLGLSSSASAQRWRAAEWSVPRRAG
jgi:hypothetical protein